MSGATGASASAQPASISPASASSGSVIAMPQAPAVPCTVPCHDQGKSIHSAVSRPRVVRHGDGAGLRVQGDGAHIGVARAQQLDGERESAPAVGDVVDEEHAASVEEVDVERRRQHLGSIQHRADPGVELHVERAAVLHPERVRDGSGRAAGRPARSRRRPRERSRRRERTGRGPGRLRRTPPTSDVPVRRSLPPSWSPLSQHLVRPQRRAAAVLRSPSCQRASATRSPARLRPRHHRRPHRLVHPRRADQRHPAGVLRAAVQRHRARSSASTTPTSTGSRPRSCCCRHSCCRCSRSSATCTGTRRSC